MKLFEFVNCSVLPLNLFNYLILLSLLTVVHCYSIIDGPSWESQYPETQYMNSHEANYIRDKLLQAMIKSVNSQPFDKNENYFEQNKNRKPMIAQQKMRIAISKNELDKITNAMRNRLFGF